MRKSQVVALALLVLLALPAAAAAGEDVEVQLLGLNDFNGHLESNTPGTIAPHPSQPRVPAGGAEYLATHLRQKDLSLRCSTTSRPSRRRTRSAST